MLTSFEMKRVKDIHSVVMLYFVSALFCCLRRHHVEGLSRRVSKTARHWYWKANSGELRANNARTEESSQKMEKD
jgi:hypothetical protein